MKSTILTIFRITVLFSITFFSSNAIAQLNEGQQFLITYNTSSSGKEPLVKGNKAGVFGFKGWTGATKYTLGAALKAKVSEDVSPGYLPLDVVIQTGAPVLEDRMNIRWTGEIGINTSSPESRLTVKQFYDDSFPNRNPFEVIGGNNNGSSKRFLLYNDNGLLSGSLEGNMNFYEGSVLVNDGDLMVKQGNTSIDKGDVMIKEGRLFIGTSDYTGDDLARIAGTLRCEEAIIDLEADWPDYVFSKQYKLMPLNELKNQINKLNHLPGVPSEKEIKENGINLGEMQKILLEKIEELTLHTIRQQEEIELLKEQLLNVTK